MTEEEIRSDLNEVNAAIRAIRNGAQEYSMMNRSVTKVDYSALLKERKELEHRLAVITGASLSYGGWQGR